MGGSRLVHAHTAVNASALKTLVSLLSQTCSQGQLAAGLALC